MTDPTKPKPTPTPWDMFVGNANGKGLIRIEAGCDSEEPGRHIASMPRGAISEANAWLIVEAVNAHAVLVEALQSARSFIVRELTTNNVGKPIHREPLRSEILKANPELQRIDAALRLAGVEP